MYKEFNPILSEEKLGAYFEGRLSPQEADVVAGMIAEDDDLREIMDINDAVDDTLEMYSQSESQASPDNMDDISLPFIDDPLSDSIYMQEQQTDDDIGNMDEHFKTDSPLDFGDTQQDDLFTDDTELTHFDI